MNKLVKFNSDLLEKIQSYADKYCEGNFNMAVRALCTFALKDE